MAYEEINKILEVMKERDWDYKEHQAFIDEVSKDKKSIMQKHISSLVYSQLSSNRPWKPIEENKENIDSIFHDFDPEYLKNANPEELVEEIKKINCGNISIHKQMSVLKDNIIMFEKIEKEHESLDEFVHSDKAKTIAKKLAKGEYKLKQVGIPLACEYLKGVGIDCAKPDKHLRRIIGRLGYSKKEEATEIETIDIISKIAIEYNKLDQKEIDTILWQYCAKGYLEICGKKPKCNLCKIKCDYSKNITLKD